MPRKKRIRVRKNSGRLETFNLRKLRRSLLRAGAERGMAESIIRDVVDQVSGETTSGEIYRLAHGMMRKGDAACGMRYTLKKALFRLGPTGYPFERYIGDIFRNYGYKTKVGETLRGRCVAHEVDVLAVGERDVSVMECKYHNARGTTTDVKVALYVHSRVRDLEPVLTARYPGRDFTGRLVTNTRCTADALDYARCTGLEVLSWNYPEDRGLEEMIERRKLYPVTVIYGMQAGLVEKLIHEGILLLNDVRSLDDSYLRKKLGVSNSVARKLKRRAEALCG